LGEGSDGSGKNEHCTSSNVIKKKKNNFWRGGACHRKERKRRLPRKEKKDRKPPIPRISQSQLLRAEEPSRAARSPEVRKR